MRLFEFNVPLQEGVVLSSVEEMAAFAVACAEAYDAAPRHDKSVEEAWNVLKRVKGAGIKVLYVPDDPYNDFGSDPKTILRAMLYDIIANKRLLIYSGHSDDHPNFSSDENVIFKTIHDCFTHGTLLKTFRKNLEAIAPELLDGERKPTREELAKIIPNVSLTKGGNRGHRFALRGELNSLSTHIRIAPKAAAPALFTEVAGQAIVGDFPVQKVAVLDGFDLRKIGQTIPGSQADERKREVMDFLRSQEAVLDLHIKAKRQITREALLKAVDSRE